MKWLDEMRKNSFSKYFLLYFAVVIYSCNAICSKVASGYTFLSWNFIFFYGLSIVLLLVYAIIWQQVLKQLELSIAYAAKPVSTILTMAWGIVLFHEKISWNTLLGAVIILIGIRMAVTEHGT